MIERILKRGLQTERHFLLRAIRRTELAMEALEAPYSFPANCCPGCACGYPWQQLAAKLERQQERLKQIDAKLARRG